MSINDYPTVGVHKRHVNISHFFSLHLEPFLLSMMLLAGVIGSLYIFGEKLIHESGKSVTGLSHEPENSAFAMTFLSHDEDKTTADFNDYIRMDKKVISGKEFSITFLQDEKASRYVMEMGDGVRLIITQKNLSYEYKEPGTYYIELKEIKDGLMHIVGTKKIKVK
jgi:hypothetical protein